MFKKIFCHFEFPQLNKLLFSSAFLNVFYQWNPYILFELLVSMTIIIIIFNSIKKYFQNKPKNNQDF